MKATKELHLVNKETARIFTRKISSQRFFMTAVITRVNGLIHDCVLGKILALVEASKINDLICTTTEELYDEIDKFEGLLERRNNFDHTKVKFMTQFKQEISCGSEININISNMIEAFDSLISIIKLVHLSDGFDSQATCFDVIKNIQKKINIMLGSIINLKATKNSQSNICDILNSNSNEDYIRVVEKNLSIILKAMESTYAPAINRSIKTQIIFRLKKLQIQQTTESSVQEAS